jgi:hypothetical protein
VGSFANALFKMAINILPLRLTIENHEYTLLYAMSSMSKIVGLGPYEKNTKSQSDHERGGIDV